MGRAFRGPQDAAEGFWGAAWCQAAARHRGAGLGLGLDSWGRQAAAAGFQVVAWCQPAADGFWGVAW